MKVQSKKRTGFFKKATILMFLVIFVFTGLRPADIVIGAASSSSTSNTTRISVHDPSVFYDPSTGNYNIYGSHMAQATSKDLRNWSALGTQGYTNNTLYASENVEGIYYIQNKFSGLYLDVADGSSANGANIRQWSYNGSDAQKFKFVSLGDGYYYILTGASGYKGCVDVETGSAADGTNILQWEYWGGEMQKYRVVQQPDGTYAILTKASGCASGLEVYDWSEEAGGNIDEWNYWGGDCQKWRLIEAEKNSGSTKVSSGEHLRDALASPFLWAGYNDQDSAKSDEGCAVWAPDIIYNPDYIWNDGSKGAYMMYFCTSSTYIRSCIAYGVSKSATGPFSYVDTIIYSGFTKSDNLVTTNSQYGTKTVNTNYANTNIPKLIEQGKLNSARAGWFNSKGEYNNTLFPNAIDPTVLFDANGKMWMTYGSWSGGIYILEIDKTTGQPIYPKTNSGQTDGYFGTRIAGGYTKSGEAPYILYDAESGYYYLYVTYGWLGVNGGYHIRMYRSKTINGSYVDAAGNSAIFDSSTNQATRGIKVFGNYDFSSLSTEGYKSGGHNSAFIDTDGRRYLVYHTRFNTGLESHEVRVHQQFLNEDKWPVTAVYEYLGSQISNTGYSMADMTGTYEFVNHGTDASTDNVGMLSTNSITLNSNGTITGDYTGTWSYTSGKYYCQMKIGGVTYKGVFFKQKDESLNHKEVMTFSLIGSNNETIWGTKTIPVISSVEGTFYIRNAYSGLYLDVENGSSENTANIRQWTYNGADAQKFKIVSNGNGYYRILTGASGYRKGLDVEGGKSADGTNIQQYNYNGSMHQQFKVERQADGTYAILTGASGGTSGLDVYDWSNEPGGNVNQWNYWGGTCQKWILEPAN
ncbi:MAG: RICIN domain-containing protein [Lachnospiraceae bacterium]|nr:family 43 glycosylhydrolase [Lachnospiraceae bacterium]MCI9368790.1 family 43 glycosylhydrolase [Lachnospiraceae bacterium]